MGLDLHRHLGLGDEEGPTRPVLVILEVEAVYCVVDVHQLEVDAISQKP